MDTRSYIAGLQEVSLPARLAIALVCFERFCRRHAIDSEQITEFLNHLWEVPLLDGPTSIQEWEESAPFLVELGLGGDINAPLQETLEKGAVSSETFCQLVMHTTEIIYGSLYGAADDLGSLKDLNMVLQLTGQDEASLPPMSTFSQSRFGERQGWGRLLSVTERDAWRQHAI